MFDLEAQRIEASGHPVVVRAPSQELEGRGESLKYDLSSTTVVLDAAGEAFLRRGPPSAADEIHGRHLEYQVGPEGRLGRALADGPGWLRMTMKDGLLTAGWEKQFRLQPQDDQHVISLVGGGHVDHATMGSLSAAQIDFWIQEVPSRARPPRADAPSGFASLGSAGPAPAGASETATGAAPQMELVPQRMHAQGRVLLESAKVTAVVGDMQSWFHQPATDWEPVPAGSAAPQPAAGPASLAGPPRPATSGERPSPQHFRVDGATLSTRSPFPLQA